MEPNEQYIEELKTIVKFHRFNVAQILNAKKNKHLLDTAVSGIQNAARIYERWLDMQVKIKSIKTDN